MNKKSKTKIKNVEIQFPVILIRTKKGLNFINKISKLKSISSIGNILLLIMPISSFIAFYLILRAISIYSNSDAARTQARELTPFANILIPGVNPLLPIFYGYIALVIALVVHESAHAIFARSFNLRVKSTGLLLLLGLPIGAFAEVDEKQLKKSSPKKGLQVLSSGPGANMVVALFSLFLLVILVFSLSPMVTGVAITGINEDSSLYISGVRAKDVIYAINAYPINSINDITSVINSHNVNDTVMISILKADENYRLVEISTLLSQRDPDNLSPYLGITIVDIENSLAEYKKRIPFSFLRVPTMSSYQHITPFSDLMSDFYSSPLGSFFKPIANLFFWIWFINFNLAIFNSLPIYPLDGGQSLFIIIRSFNKNSINEKLAYNITIFITFIFVSIVALLLLITYISIF